jgi:hypothetical protein
MIVPGGGLSLDNARWVTARSNFLVHVNVLACLFRGKMLAMLMDAHDAGQLNFFNTHAGLADKSTFKRFIAPLRRIDWVVYCKPAVRRTRAGTAISVPLHSPGRHLQQPPRCGRRRRHRVPLEGLSRQRSGPLEDDATSPAGVHQAIPAPCAAQGLPSHPPLRALRLNQSRREHRNGPRSPQCRPACRRSPKTARCCAGHPAGTALALPVLGARMIIIETFAPGCQPSWRPTLIRIDTS